MSQAREGKKKIRKGSSGIGDRGGKGKKKENSVARENVRRPEDSLGG